MTNDPARNRASIGRGHMILLLAATAMTCLLIVLGGVVCITDASAACPDWPWCYGRAVPPPEIKAILEYTHRLVAALTTPLIVAAAVVGWRRARGLPWVSRPPLLAIAFVLAVIVFGALVVLRGLSRGAAAVDLGSALMVLALLVTATVAAAARRRQPTRPDRLSWSTPLGRLSLAALVAVYAVLVSGVLVAEPGSVVRCLGWPLYGVAGRAHAARAVLGGVAGLLVLATVIQVWGARYHGPLARTATAVALCLLAALALVLLRSEPSLAGAPLDTAWAILSAAAATGLWAGVVALAIRAGLPDSNHSRG